MGPDLLGLIGATGFILVVLTVFGLVERILCGASDALRNSPGASLVAGMAAWGRGSQVRACYPSKPTSE